ncbi:MAG: TRAP transporter small permease subunit [Pseudomonadota bacterium]
MGELFAGMGEILAAFGSNDSFMIRSALRAEAAWLFGLIVMMAGGVAILIAYRLLPILDRQLEAWVMVTSYLTIGAIIFFGVIQRFVPGMLGMDPTATPNWLQPWPWTTTIPPFLFLIMTWVGCSYNVKLRTHLAFSEFRMAMPRAAQFACLTLDAILWLGFSWVVVVTSSRIVANSASNFQIMLGTDNVMQWWFLIAVPLSFIFLVARVLENWLADVQNLRSGEPLIKQAVIGGDA